MFVLFCMEGFILKTLGSLGVIKSIYRKDITYNFYGFKITASQPKKYRIVARRIFFPS